MPIPKLRRSLRRLSRQARNWTTVVNLTLKGNKIEKRSNLRNAHNPILMIYGFGATRRTLAILENRLKQDGYTIFSLNLGGFFGTFNTESIEESARYIDTKIEKIYKKYNIRGKLSVIGHSKGGLIGQYYIKMLNGSKRVKTFITLGTPHNGNPWCLIGAFTPITWFCKSIKQMSPLSSFLKALKETSFPKSIQVYSIYSKDDVVCPFPVSVLEDEGDNITNIEVFGVTHSEFLIKKSVYNAIKHGLKNEMPASWSEASKRNYEEHLKEKKSRFKIIKGISEK